MRSACAHVAAFVDKQNVEEDIKYRHRSNNNSEQKYSVDNYSPDLHSRELEACSEYLRVVSVGCPSYSSLSAIGNVKAACKEQVFYECNENSIYQGINIETQEPCKLGW